jgi:hypothetical protein
MALAGCVILAAFDWTIFAGLYGLWPLAALLFLWSWWLHRSPALTQNTGSRNDGRL